MRKQVLTEVLLGLAISFALWIAVFLYMIMEAEVRQFRYMGF